jgi:hypothetical protein
MCMSLTQYVIEAATELGLLGIQLKRRSKHMRLTARTPSGEPILVHFAEHCGDWRARKNLVAELRRQARGIGRPAWAA